MECRHCGEAMRARGSTGPVEHYFCPECEVTVTYHRATDPNTHSFNALKDRAVDRVSRLETLLIALSEMSDTVPT